MVEIEHHTKIKTPKLFYRNSHLSYTYLMSSSYKNYPLDIVL